MCPRERLGLHRDYYRDNEDLLNDAKIGSKIPEVIQVPINTLKLFSN